MDSIVLDGAKYKLKFAIKLKHEFRSKYNEFTPRHGKQIVIVSKSKSNTPMNQDNKLRANMIAPIQ